MIDYNTGDIFLFNQNTEKLTLWNLPSYLIKYFTNMSLLWNSYKCKRYFVISDEK